MSTSYTDSRGDRWTLRLTVGLLGKARREADVDLAAVLKDPQVLASLLFQDPEKLARVLWIIVEDDAAMNGITPEGFVGALDGSTLEAATVSLLEAIADFFPRSAVAQAMKAKLTEMLKEMDSRILASISTSSNGVGGSPESSASTPPNGPSVN